MALTEFIVCGFINMIDLRQFSIKSINIIDYVV